MKKRFWEVSNPPPAQSRLTSKLGQIAQGLVSFASPCSSHKALRAMAAS